MGCGNWHERAERIVPGFLHAKFRGCAEAPGLGWSLLAVGGLGG